MLQQEQPECNAQFSHITHLNQVQQAIHFMYQWQPSSQGQWKLVPKSIRTTVPTSLEKEEEQQLIFCNYRQSVNTLFPSPDDCTLSDQEMQVFRLLREIRGLVFLKNNGITDSYSSDIDIQSSSPPISDARIAGRPLHKFFNVNENEELTCHELAKKHTNHKLYILEKMDGSMITPILLPIGKSSFRLLFCTKMGFDTYSAKLVHQFVYESEKAPIVSQSQLTSNEQSHTIVRFCYQWINDGYTPIFEWCSPKNKIILDYEHDKLVLIAIRHMTSGNYVPYSKMLQSAQVFGIECTRELNLGHNNLELQLTEELVNKIKNEYRDMEGAVLRFEHLNESSITNCYCSMYKVKTKWYHDLHKSKQHIQWNAPSEAKVWLLVLDNKVDDTVAVLDSPDMIQSLIEFSEELWRAVNDKIIQISELMLPHLIDCYQLDEKRLKERKRNFAALIKSSVENTHERTVVLKAYDHVIANFTKGDNNMISSRIGLEEYMKEMIESELIEMLRVRLNRRVEEARQLLGTSVKFTPKKSFFGMSD